MRMWLPIFSNLYYKNTTYQNLYYKNTSYKKLSFEVVAKLYLV